MQHSRTSPSICLSLPYLSTYLSFIFCLFWFDCLVRICDFRAHTISPPPSPCLFFVFIDFWFSTFDFLNHIYNIYWYGLFLSVLNKYLLVQLYNMIYSYGYDDIHLRLVFCVGWGEVRRARLIWTRWDESEMNSIVEDLRIWGLRILLSERARRGEAGISKWKKRRGRGGKKERKRWVCVSSRALSLDGWRTGYGCRFSFRYGYGYGYGYGYRKYSIDRYGYRRYGICLFGLI